MLLLALLAVSSAAEFEAGLVGLRVGDDLVTLYVDPDGVTRGPGLIVPLEGELWHLDERSAAARSGDLESRRTVVRAWPAGHPAPGAPAVWVSPDSAASERVRVAFASPRILSWSSSTRSELSNGQSAGRAAEETVSTASLARRPVEPALLDALLPGHPPTSVCVALISAHAAIDDWRVVREAGRWVLHLPRCDEDGEQADAPGRAPLPPELGGDPLTRPLADWRAAHPGLRDVADGPSGLGVVLLDEEVVVPLADGAHHLALPRATLVSELWTADRGEASRWKAALTEAPEAAPAPGGVDVALVGVRTPDRALRTLRVGPGVLEDLGSGVLLQRPEGLVRLDLTRDGAFEHLQARPEGAAPPPVPALAHVDAQHTTLLFAGPASLAFEREQLRTRGDGSVVRARWELGFLGVHQLLEGESALLPAEDTLGDDVARAAIAAHASWNPSGSAALVRSRGAWVARVGWRTDDGEPKVVGVSAPPPPRLVGHDALPRPWTDLAAAHPALQDALASPSGGVLLLVFPDRLELYEGGDLVATHRIAGAAVVSAQWARDADQAAAWTRQP